MFDYNKRIFVEQFDFFKKGSDLLHSPDMFILIYKTHFIMAIVVQVSDVTHGPIVLGHESHLR